MSSANRIAEITSPVTMDASAGTSSPQCLRANPDNAAPTPRSPNGAYPVVPASTASRSASVIAGAGA